MKAKTTLPISEARRTIFEIAERVQEPDVYYTLTEHGRPKAVLLSVNQFEELSERKSRGLFAAGGALLADGAEYGYGDQPLFPRKKLPQSNNPVVALKAILLVRLIEEYGYPVSALEFGNFVPVSGREGKRFIEADILAYDRLGRVVMVVEVAPFESYDLWQEQMVRNLFDIAHSVSEGGKTRWLVYFSRRVSSARREELKIMAIDARKCATFGQWQEAGCPAETTIPKYAG